ncbi:hypothetical protein CC1G_15163 [Coprinopsis cinerea okayama7|uniref:Uncharacterized protein n=1 Tax=Coprinopsis cinerea (strain Okayama-7 / 130 / ATCC MYA-4618 / FGSC 9003) TaxID=240176 RepID=D6RPT0_COPC7|nr:hypothetical protein CC1G_15163 [Coprinopsis cinerea okayama7\|eukprot:XP_002910524.1 hypothetical protein CC1G_15163 [Coprinopsis cinerea okayama7\
MDSYRGDEKLPFLIVAVFTSQSVMLVAHSCHAGRVWGMLSKPWKMIAPICTFMTLVRYIGSFIAGAFYFKVHDNATFRAQFGPLSCLSSPAPPR